MKMFSYNSKFSQIVMLVVDYVLLNLLYLLCCIPLFTIGAAQAGLYSAIALLNDKEDDSSPYRKFFEGFRSGFGTITITWSVTLALVALSAYSLIAVLYLDGVGAYAPIWVCVVGLVILAIYQSVMTIFHYKFGCTARQLFRNTLFVIFAHPLRSIAVAALTWLPVILFVLAYDVFAKNLLILLFAYYSLVFTLNLSLMKKPFETLVENFINGNEEDAASEESQDSEE